MSDDIVKQQRPKEHGERTARGQFKNEHKQ